MADGRPAAVLKAAMKLREPWPASMAAEMDVEVAGIVRAPASPPLNILHLLRAPLGGLFRHVVDLVVGQAARGHRVGLVVDSTTGGARADAALAELAPHLALGVKRVAISRELGPSDIVALRQVSGWIRQAAPDVLHGHGAKGAALARLTLSAPHAIRVYTPHGGSLVYRPGTLAGGFYRTLEWALKWRTDLFLFESSYIASLFRAEIGLPPGMVRVVHNGVGEVEFAPIVPRPDATDIICLGELRPVKAFDVLIEALAVLNHKGRPVSATIAGEGPDQAKLEAQAERIGIADRVRLVGYRPARDAFAMGRIMVIPSRAESLPYVILEAAAAGVPIISTRVGGVPEIFGPQSDHLIPPDDIGALIGAIAAALDNPVELKRIAQLVKARVRAEFSLPAMIDGGLAAYREAMVLRKLAQFA
ncbi:MAG: glycosyltransferase family 4 protein [Xanthobacteraceae bacterium]